MKTLLKMNMKWILLILIALVATNSSMGQETEKKKFTVDYTTVNAFYVAGGQFYNNTLLFSPGYGAKISAGKKIHKDIDVGMGAGFIALNKEHFYPAFIEIQSYKSKKDNTPYVKFQVGYAVAQYTDNTLANDYDLQGGVSFCATLGRRVRLNDTFTVLFDISYGHQTAKLNYRAHNEIAYEDKLDYEMFMLALGLVIE